MYSTCRDWQPFRYTYIVGYAYQQSNARPYADLYRLCSVHIQVITYIFIISFQHTGTPILFLDDPGELTSEERCSVTKGPAKQVDELCQVVIIS